MVGLTKQMMAKCAANWFPLLKSVSDHQERGSTIRNPPKILDPSMCIFKEQLS